MMPDIIEQAVANHPGFVLDVPVTFTVAVRGPGITVDQAIAAARELVNNLEPAGDQFLAGYAQELGREIIITETSLENAKRRAVQIEPLLPEGILE